MLERKCFKFLTDFLNSKEPENGEHSLQLNGLLKMINNASYEELQRVWNNINNDDFFIYQKRKIKKNFTFFSPSDKKIIPLSFSFGVALRIMQNLEDIFSYSNMLNVLQSGLYGALVGVMLSIYITNMQEQSSHLFKMNVIHLLKERFYNKIIDFHSENIISPTITI